MFVNSPGTFTEWRKLVTVLTKELFTTKWGFREIVRKMSSQHKWAQAPVLNQWAHMVQNGGTVPNIRTSGATGATFDDFMFNPAKFSTEEITRLRSLCMASSGVAHRHHIRDGTDDEWSIIVGLVEGTIACRRMPSFLNQVLKSEERLRLYSTIQAQVEGELILHLDGRREIKASRQTTKALTETILASAELARIDLQALHQMLGQTKTICYNQVTKSIHFYFFTRTTADRHKSVQVPYQGGVYTLHNAHCLDQGPIWARQTGGRPGTSGRRPEYTIQLHNLTRFNDIGRMAAYLQANIPTEFDMDDMDTHKPDSRTSTVWSVTFKLAGCPTFLDGVVRILWFGTTIIIKHPNVGYRLQCLRCGHLGHTLSRCGSTEEQLRGPGGIVVKEEDIRELEDLAKPFGSLDEIRSMAAQRVQLQQRAEAAAQAAVTPIVSSDGPPTPPSLTRAEVSVPDRGQTVEQGEKFAYLHTEPTPRPEQPWITKPLRGKRDWWTHPSGPTRPAAPLIPSSGAFHVLNEEHVDTPAKSKKKRVGTTLKLRSQGVRDLTKIVPMTRDDLLRKEAAFKRGPAQRSTAPVLMTHKRRERSKFLQLQLQKDAGSRTHLQIGARSSISPSSISELSFQLGVREVTTPATGNCMAMAVAQASADAPLDGPDQMMERLTEILKKGIKYSGLLHLEDQFAHDHRVQALHNVHRGWPTITRSESANQMRWFLDDYAASSSKPDIVVTPDTWGGSDTLGMAANFLQRDIYVIQHITGDNSDWVCRKYTPRTITRQRRVVGTSAEYNLTVAECMDEIIAGKIEHPSTPPLIPVSYTHLRAHET